MTEIETEVFTAMQELIEPIETGYFASDIFLNAIIAGILQQIWALI